MNRLITTGKGGFPLVLDDVRWALGQISGTDNHGIYQALNNILGGFGSDYIVQGCEVSGTSPNVTVGSGWVVLSGELLRVDEQTGIDTTTDSTFIKQTTFDSRGDKTFQSLANESTYEENRAAVSGVVGSLSINANRVFNGWGEKVLTSSDIKDTAGNPIFVSGISTDDDKVIRYNITGKTCYCDIRLVGGEATVSPTSNIVFRLPDGIIAANKAEGNGYFRNSDLPSPGAGETVNTPVRLAARSTSFFTVLGDSIEVSPSFDASEQFNISGLNNVRVLGQIFFEIE